MSENRGEGIADLGLRSAEWGQGRRREKLEIRMERKGFAT
jgi:hypothetical protein